MYIQNVFALCNIVSCTCTTCSLSGTSAVYVQPCDCAFQEDYCCCRLAYVDVSLINMMFGYCCVTGWHNTHAANIQLRSTGFPCALLLTLLPRCIKNSPEVFHLVGSVLVLPALPSSPLATLIDVGEVSAEFLRQRRYKRPAGNGRFR